MSSFYRTFYFFTLRLFLGWVVILLCSTSLLAQKSVPPGEYFLSGVRVEGIEHADRNAIMLISGLQIGQKIKIPGEELGNAIRQLWKQNLFANVSINVDRVEGNKIFIVLELEERPRISKYKFDNITKPQADDLEEKQLFKLGQRFTEANRRAAVRSIQNYFYEKGFLNCAVEIKTRPDEAMANGVTIIGDIKKGKKVKIREIVVNGNDKISDNSIRRQLKDTKQQRWWRLWKRSKYIPLKFQEDKEKIVAYLNSKGRRDARLISDTVLSVNRRQVDLVINVHEGPEYYFRNVSFVGNTKYPTEELNRRLGIKKGMIYNGQQLDRRLSADPSGTDVSSLYLDDGYLFFRADPVEMRVENDSIDLEIQIYEGPQARYNKILLEGNTITSDHVVLRQVRTLPGQKFSRSELIRSQREILNLGYFSQEKMNVIPIPNVDKGTVDIKYVVEERPNNQFFVQGGWGGRAIGGNAFGSGLIATVGIRLNNFSTSKMFKKGGWRPIPTGDGQTVSFQIQYNPQFQNFGISFMEPWLGGKKPTSLGVSVNYSLYSFWNQPNSIFRTLSLSTDLGKMMKWPDDYFRSYTSLTYRYYQARQIGGFFLNGLDNGDFTAIALRQTFDRTSIDVPIYPTTGSTLNFSVEATPPWSYFSNKNYEEMTPAQRFRLVEYHKWKFKVETYTKLTRVKLPMVFYSRVMGGYLGEYNRKVGTSPLERFFIGGDGLVNMALSGTEIVALRGYANYTVGGQYPKPIFNKYTFELRQAISTAPTATVWVHGFAEAGYGWNTFAEYNPFQLYRSVGGGVRIFLPMFGLLGIDYGYGFDQAVDNPNALRSGGHFHFMIGQQF